MTPGLELIRFIIDEHSRWRSRWEPYAEDPSLAIPEDAQRNALSALFDRLQESYPFFHPEYAGQMLKPPHPAAVLGYLAAMLINPNNHALDGGPATGHLEKEVVADLAAMVGYEQFLGHLTSSGTIANLESLWVAREMRPGTPIAYSEHSHYTHARMCQVLGVRGIEVPADDNGKMDAHALRTLCLSEDIGTVVATVGTTGCGALDPLSDILDLREEFRFRVHADAAYGGFFGLIASGEDPLTDAKVFGRLAECDSIVIDPHKHGLQPYGCGCVLFSDPSIGRLYKHDSPYTYFTSSELHLGEISLECSRAGASAAALWLTLQCLPLRSNEGLGGILRACRMAALEWAGLIRTSPRLFLLLEPELDIVTFFCGTPTARTSDISAYTDAIFTAAMNDSVDRVYLSKLRVKTRFLTSRYPGIITDSEWTTVLRSTLMKPEHLRMIPELHRRVELHAERVLTDTGTAPQAPSA
jgi:glutamate/tyrosine decarboxylase-like PLP-dependent enzyme